MAVKKSTTKRSSSKAKRSTAKRSEINLNAILADQLSSHPIGKALSAIDTLYRELDDMQMRLDILITRIDILKKRTAALRHGELITLNTNMSSIYSSSKTPNASNADSTHAAANGENDDQSGKVEWTKIKLLKETTVNDVVLESETVVSIESQAAANLIDQGFAEALEVAVQEEEKEKEKEENEK
tara:strand:- start:362 stop:916 length:555 start_codon:yes stop_codon:yes gene_type:complete